MSCRKCGKCCRSTDLEKRIVIIYPSDLIHISNTLHISKKEFIHKYCEKDDIQCEGYVIKIYMLKNINNQCIFLSDNNLCEIFEHRPIQCRKAPYSYFAYEDIWEHMPCFDLEEMSKSNSAENDEELVLELLRGYNIESKV